MVCGLHRSRFLQRESSTDNDDEDDDDDDDADDIDDDDNGDNDDDIRDDTVIIDVSDVNKTSSEVSNGASC